MIALSAMRGLSNRLWQFRTRQSRRMVEAAIRAMRGHELRDIGLRRCDIGFITARR